jgi:ribosome biogenesis GTP-binding protein YsxC/EngB
VFGLLVEAGAEVVIPTPHYPCYPNFVRFCGGAPVFVPTDPADGFAVDVDAVRRAVGPRTAAIVLGSPANPTGAVQSAATLAALAGLGVPLVSDEIYDGLVFDGGAAPSALAAGDEVYVLDGFSKRYAMTGFRLGFAIAPKPALRPLQVMQQNLFISCNEFVQRAGVAALASGEPTRRADSRRSASASRWHRAAPSTSSPTRAPSAATRAGSPSTCSSARTSPSRRAWTSARPARDSCASRSRRRTSASRRRSRVSPRRSRLARPAEPGTDVGGSPRILAARLAATAADAAGFPRDGLPEVAFLGRSNVGKSSLLNALVQRRALARTSATPGKTRLAHFFEVERDTRRRSHRRVLLVDLPGYGWAQVSKTERTAWQRLVEGYLGGREALRLAILLHDVRRDPRDEELDLLAWLSERGIAAVVAVTKCDKERPGRRAARLRAIAAACALPPERVVATSAAKREGIDALWAAIDEHLASVAGS